MTLNELINELKELQENGYGEAIVYDVEDASIFDIRVFNDKEIIINFDRSYY